MHGSNLYISAPWQFMKKRLSPTTSLLPKASATCLDNLASLYQDQPEFSKAE
ncbi:MAG: hypothetical protein HY774_15475 [Acidobacteria bacterium]|nr:hypothetical protein [Acidobacteriota bacterium]